MRIEISIVDDRGGGRVLATNTEMTPDGQSGGLRAWHLDIDTDALRSLTSSQAWAASHLLLEVACTRLPVSSEYPPAMAAVNAHMLARQELNRSKREDETLTIRRRQASHKDEARAARRLLANHDSIVKRQIEHDEERRRLAAERTAQTPDNAVDGEKQD